MAGLVATIDPGPVWSSFSTGMQQGIEMLLAVLVALAAIVVFRRIGGF